MSFWDQLLFLLRGGKESTVKPKTKKGGDVQINDDPDQVWASSGQCPECGSADWYEGPSGGMSTNYMCANDACGAKYNFTPFPGGKLMRELISHGKLHKPELNNLYGPVSPTS